RDKGPPSRRRFCAVCSPDAQRHHSPVPPPRENSRSVFPAQNIRPATVPKAFPVLVWGIPSSCESKIMRRKVEPAFSRLCSDRCPQRHIPLFLAAVVLAASLSML